VLVTGNEEAEVERIATEILLMTVHKRLHFKDFAVLYRGNHQARLLEIQLQAHQVPYVLTGGTSFFSRTEIKDLMAQDWASNAGGARQLCEQRRGQLVHRVRSHGPRAASQ
jgi:hypothetical protein